MLLLMNSSVLSVNVFIVTDDLAWWTIILMRAILEIKVHLSFIYMILLIYLVVYLLTYLNFSQFYS